MSTAGDEGRGALSRVLVPSFRRGDDHQSWRRIAPDARDGLPIARLPLAEDVGRAAPGIAATRVYSAFLRVGFTVPPVSPHGAVGSYPAFSPLPDPPCGGHRRSESLWHFPSTSFEAVLPLATTLPCGARTFLDLITSRPRSPAPRPSSPAFAKATAGRPAFQRTVTEQTVYSVTDATFCDIR